MSIAPAFTYSASVVKVVDGDTVDLIIDLGFCILTSVRCRLYGINTPEDNAGLPAKGRLQELINEQAIGDTSYGPMITIKTHKGRQKDKYGRWLVELFGTKGESSLNAQLVAEGFAVPFMEDKK